jgi:predicted nucleotidyltransferase
MKIDANQIDVIQRYFKNQPVLKAYLFGSYVRGEATAQSDIDILVELDYTQNVGLEFVQMQLDLQRLLNNPIDLISARSLSAYLQPVIEQEKKLIYAR